MNGALWLPNSDKCWEPLVIVFLYSISAKRGNSHSTNLSYRSPTFSINRCFRACTRAASHGFKTRLSRNLISAGVKPSFSARNIHSSPPKGKKTQKYWVLAITSFKSLEFESSSRNLNDYLSLQCGHASEYYVSERMMTIALVLFSMQSISLEGLNSFYKEFRGETERKSVTAHVAAA